MSEDAFAKQLARPDLANRDDGASGFSCPECHGNLWELRDGALVQYQCRVGHVLSADSLVAEQAVAIEAMLWAALNVLQERAALLRRLDGHRGADAGLAVPCSGGLADAAERQAELVRQALQEAMLAQGGDRAPRLGPASIPLLSGRERTPRLTQALSCHCRRPRTADVQLCTHGRAYGAGTLDSRIRQLRNERSSPARATACATAAG